MGEEAWRAPARPGRGTRGLVPLSPNPWSLRGVASAEEAVERDDEHYMAMAIDCARRVAFTSPNPRVGAVLVRGADVIGTGHHAGPGHAHAEIAALRGVDAGGATLYVTLEPCSHHGRTPPCAPALVAAGVARVVAPFEDPDPRVSGNGFDHLKSHGVEVTRGVLGAEARALLAGYLHHTRTGRPLVTLKLALTIDGHLAAPDGGARWITGASARRRVHSRRAEADAVLVGAGTVLADDPALTVRAVRTNHQPVRVVVDATGRIPADARIFAGPASVIVATTEHIGHEQEVAYKEAGAEVLLVAGSPGRVDLDELVVRLGERGFQEIYCEGGAALATSLLRQTLVDRLEINYGPVLTGGGPSLGDLGVTTMSEAKRWTTVDVERADGDVIWVLERAGEEV